MKLIPSLVSSTLLGGVAFGLAGAATAQTGSDTRRVQKPFHIKLGVFLPSDSDIRDGIGHTFFSYGISYDFAKSKAERPLIYSVYVDGATKSRSVSSGDFDGTARYTYTGVGPAVRYSLNSPNQSTRFYAGLGLGAYFIDRRASFGTDDGFDITASKNDTRFGGKLLAGAELKNGIFAEADYTLIGEVDDARPGGFNIALGYRF